MRSCGVNFERSEILRFLRGPNGGLPPKISNSFFAVGDRVKVYIYIWGKHENLYSPTPHLKKSKQAEAEVVPSSSLVEVEVKVEVVVEIGVGVEVVVEVGVEVKVGGRSWA